jgi:hypothetical protein
MNAYVVIPTPDDVLDSESMRATWASHDRRRQRARSEQRFQHQAQTTHDTEKSPIEILDETMARMGSKSHSTRIARGERRIKSSRRLIVTDGVR